MTEMLLGRIGIGRVDTALITFGFGVIDLQPPAVEACTAQGGVQRGDQFVVGASELVVQVTQLLIRDAGDQGWQQFAVTRLSD